MCGAGIGLTTLKLVGVALEQNAPYCAIGTTGFLFAPALSGFSVENLTIDCNVDGQPPQRLLSGTEFFIKRHVMAMTFDRLKQTIPYGDHKLTLRALPEKPAGSLGNVIKIGAIVTQ